MLTTLSFYDMIKAQEIKQTNAEDCAMQFTTHLKISPNYEEGVFPADRMPSRSATNTSLRDGSILYLMGRTVLCKYDVSDASEPRLLKKVDVAASHPTEDTTDYINKYNAHSTAILDIGKYLAVSLRGGGGGVKNMADGVVVGAVVVIDKESLTVVKELCFENRVTYINRYENLLIVSLHFHGFYIYEITDDEIICCVCKHIEEEKPRKATTREFQNCAVFDAEDGKINISFASYLYGICTYTYDKRAKAISYCCELNPKAFPDTYDPKSGVTNTVFGLTSKGGFVYGGITPGNNRFREQFKDVDWHRFDKRGVVYGPHDNLAEEHFLMKIPDCDKPEYIGAIAGDPAPSFLCTVGDFLLFNLDKQGVGIARIGDDGKLQYVGRALADPDGRQLTYQLRYDGEFLYASYKTPVPEDGKPPVFCLYKVAWG